MLSTLPTKTANHLDTFQNNWGGGLLLLCTTHLVSLPNPHHSLFFSLILSFFPPVSSHSLLNPLHMLQSSASSMVVHFNYASWSFFKKTSITETSEPMTTAWTLASHPGPHTHKHNFNLICSTSFLHICCLMETEDIWCGSLQYMALI